MQDLLISADLTIPRREIELTAVRSQGPGGQHVNKTACGIHLRFDIHNSTLPVPLKTRLLRSSDRRISKEGLIVIKSQSSRSQEQNRTNALLLLREIIRAALKTAKPRKQTRPGKSATEKRIAEKKQRGKVKELRQSITD